MANNAKLSYEQMRDMINLFVSLKLNSLRIGDFEISKNSYPMEKTADNKSALSEDNPLFYSAPSLPPEIQDMLVASMKINK